MHVLIFSKCNFFSLLGYVTAPRLGKYMARKFQRIEKREIWKTSSESISVHAALGGAVVEGPFQEGNGIGGVKDEIMSILSPFDDATRIELLKSLREEQSSRVRNFSEIGTTSTDFDPHLKKCRRSFGALDSLSILLDQCVQMSEVVGGAQSVQLLRELTNTFSSSTDLALGDSDSTISDDRFGDGFSVHGSSSGNHYEETLNELDELIRNAGDDEPINSNIVDR